MKKILSFIKISALLFVCWINIFPQDATPFTINEAPLPHNGQPVNDFANVIDDATEAQLNQKIKDFKARTNPPIVLAVATVETTGDRSIFDYSLALYRGWKIGAAGEDSPGALLLIAVNDKKYFTQVSRDLEDELPDGLAGQLQRQYLVPALKQGDFNKGVSETIDAYIRTIESRTSGTVTSPTAQTEPTPQRERSRRTNSSLSGAGCCLIIVIVIIIFIISRRGGGGNNRWGGGGGFGGGSALPWIIGSILANSASSRGSDWGSGGSSWGGGGFGGGGGSDWGGFGGGGDAGGGGAGGDW